MAVNSFTDPETGKQFWTCLSTDTKPSGFYGALLWETDTNIKYEGYGGTIWKATGSDGTSYFADIGIPGIRNNRYLSGITKTWPGDDSFSVAFTSAENIRTYTIKAIRTSYDLWTATTAFAVGTIVHPTAAVDNAGAPDLVFIVDSVSGTGTSAGAEPTWPTVVGGTVTDNAGANQIIWKALPADAVFLKVAEDAANEAQEESWLADPTSSRTATVNHFRVYDGVEKRKELTINPSDIPLSRLGFLANADTWEIFVEAE